MGSLKCGFWKTKFFVTPDEFEEILNICEENEIAFVDLLNGDVVESYEDKIRLVEDYKELYAKIVSKEKSESGPIMFRHDLLFKANDVAQLGSFHMASEDFDFPCNKKWIVIPDMYLVLSYPKGYPIEAEGSKGPITMYEDITEYEPLGYPKFESITKHIRGITRDLKFIAYVIDSFDELNGHLRISRQAAIDLQESWFFKANDLKMACHGLNKKEAS